MKITIKKMLLAGSLALIAVTNGCNDSFLDGPKPTGPTEENYFVEEDEFERAVYGIYAKMNDWYSWNGGSTGAGGNNPNFTLWVLPGDDATSSGGGDMVALEAFGPLQASNGVTTRFYNASYQIIGRANVVLEKIEAVQDGIYVTPGLKDYHKGEALFLRAYVFFNLWNYYGKAPLVTKRLNQIEDAYPFPSEGTQLLDQAIADLQQAETLLPDVWNEANRGRVTKNSAHGMLGKVLVFRGTVTENTADFTDAIAAFDRITGVSLVANFDDNHAADTENNNESLFEYQASQAGGGDNIWLPDDFDTNIGSMSTAGYVGFENINNFGYGGSRIVATQKLVDLFDPGDPRLPLTVNATTRNVTKYVLRDQKNQVNASSVNNPRLLRYADVLLLKAEAVLRSGGSIATAIGLINEVRTRARNMSAGSAPANRNVAETDNGRGNAMAKGRTFYGTGIRRSSPLVGSEKMGAGRRDHAY
jgi:tetratricopeptide (TPR) repeat protein